MPFWGKKKEPTPAEMEAQGVAAFEQGDYQTAAKTFANLCDIEPTSERLYYLGVLMDMLGVQEGAISALTAAVEMDPENSQAFYSLSIVYSGMENFEGAFEAITKAYEVDPDDFRIVNHLAMLMCQSPVPEHRDPPRAVELAKQACELTDWQDEICQQTYETAKAAVGESAADDIAEGAAANAEEDLTFEIIEHFEKRFSRKANERSLQNIIPACDVAVAVQTIEATSSDHSTVAFTTGMSAKPMRRSDGEGLKFAELFMLIHPDWKVGEQIDEKIWPWHRLQQLAYLPHMGQEGYSRDPQVATIGDSPEKLGAGAEFTAFLLLPNPKGFVEPLQARSGRTVDFIMAMPIFSEEFEMASQPGGVDKLIQAIMSSRTRPEMAPGRANLAE